MREIIKWGEWVLLAFACGIAWGVGIDIGRIALKVAFIWFGWL